MEIAALLEMCDGYFCFLKECVVGEFHSLLDRSSLLTSDSQGKTQGPGNLGSSLRWPWSRAVTLGGVLQVDLSKSKSSILLPGLWLRGAGSLG